MKWAGVGDEMAVTVEMQNTDDPALRQEVVATVEHVLSDRAGDTAALMLGAYKPRGYCLEMICADFLAGANLDSGDPNMLLRALYSSFKFLPENQRQAFLQIVSGQIQ